MSAIFTNFRFLHANFLWLLLLLLPLALFYARRGPAPALLFSSTSLLRSLGTPRKASAGRLTFLLRMLSLALLIIALARPQYGNSTTEIEASGIDIMLAVDVSGSMEAMDFHLDGKAVNRLAVVKKVVEKFIDKRPNDRIGLIAFGARPYLVSPLTLDHDWLLKRMDALKIGMGGDGTAIGSAIGTGVNRLREQKAKSRILILLTDGMSNSGSISPLTAAEAAETLAIKVYTIGAGTRGEAPIPVRDSYGRVKLAWMKVDIDENTLKQVAKLTGASYFRATNTASLEKIYGEINKMETTTRKIKKFENYRELFPWVLLFFFLAFAAEIYLSRRRVP